MKIHIIDSRNDLQNFRKIYLAARNCYNNKSVDSLDKSFTKENAISLTKKLLNWQHMSVFEHITYSLVLENVSRSFLAQLSRHRIGLSLTVKSQHYIDHDNFEYKPLENVNTSTQKYYDDVMKSLKEHYKVLREVYEVPHYIAREILPNSTLCNVFMTVNLRELIHIFSLRLGKENTPEIREVFKQIYNLLFKENYELFEVIEEHYDFMNKF